MKYTDPSSNCPVCGEWLFPDSDTKDPVYDMQRHYWWHKLEKLSRVKK